MISTKLSDGYWNQIKRLQKMLKKKNEKNRLHQELSILIAFSITFDIKYK